MFIYFVVYPSLSYLTHLGHHVCQIGNDGCINVGPRHRRGHEESKGNEGIPGSHEWTVSRELFLLLLVHLDVHKLHSSLPLQRWANGFDEQSCQVARDDGRSRGKKFSFLWSVYHTWK